MGLLERRTVVLVWTPRGKARRIISLRYAYDCEKERAADVVNIGADAVREIGPKVHLRAETRYTTEPDRITYRRVMP